MNKFAVFHLLLAAAGAASAASPTELIFQTDAVSDANSLAKAKAKSSTCGNVNVSFRLQSVPAADHSALDSMVSYYEASQSRYYITAGSSDYAKAGFPLMWDSGAVCWNLQNRSTYLQGIYLHEVLSARVSTTGSFSAADWGVIGQYASCAKTAQKKIVWSEFAGSSWGWQYFLSLLAPSAVGSLPTAAKNAILPYKDVFVFLWANNRNLTDPSQASDLVLAKSLVEQLGTTANPVGYAFPWGVSAQDWQWYDSGADPAKIAASAIGGPVIDAYQQGGRYFQFEKYWTSPGFDQGTSDVRSYVRVANGCTDQQP